MALAVFLTIEALSFPNMNLWYGKLLDVHCSLVNSNLLYVVPDLSCVRHRGLFLVNFVN